MSSLPPSPYRHEQLQHVDSIRLCVLDPGQTNDPIVCNLHHVQLSSKPSYDAISYTWGSLQTVGTITCNDYLGPVTANLFQALKYLRHSEEKRTIWIDQLCINQKNLNERSQQVAIMRDIYRMADRTLVWLGEAAEGSEEAMDLIPRIVDATKPPYTESSLFVTDWPALGLPPITDPVWISFGRLIKRAWFRRTWTLQEAAVATDVVVMCGTKEHPWSMWEELIDTPIRSLLTIPENLTPNPNMLDQPHAMTAFGQVSVIKGLRRILAAKSNSDAAVDVLTLFSHGRRLGAKEPRDKVFALLRLTSPAFQQFITAPDYKRPVEDIYIEAAIKILVSSDSLDFLYSAGCSTQQHPLPSWVPDWSVPVFYPSFGHYHLFSACGTAEGRQGWAETADDPTRLQVKGKVLMEVSELGGPFKSGEPDLPYQDLIEHFVPRMKHQHSEVEKCCAMAGSQLTYPTGENPTTVCKQVLVGGTKMTVSSQEGAYPWVRMTASDADHFFGCYEEYMKIALRIEKFDKDRIPMNKEIFGVAQKYLEAFDLATSRRVFCKTLDGHMGLVPSGTSIGDYVCIILGCDVPFVIRKHDDAWNLVGECYVHGIMDGEGFDNKKIPVQGMWLI